MTDGARPSSPSPETTDRSFGSGVLVHIGYHKTGTTWLQRTVFPREFGSFDLPWKLREVAGLFVHPHELEWEPGPVQDALGPGIAAAREAGLVPVVSSEELSGNPHSGGHGSADYAGRLARALPGARVLIVVRRQPAMLESVYKQYVKRGGTQPAGRYFVPPPQWFRYRRCRLANWEYDRLVARYHRLFGADRVKVLPQELLATDSAAFVREITDFCGARPIASLRTERENIGLSALAAALQRRTNRYFHRDDINEGAPFAWPRVAGAWRRLDALFLRRIAGPAERRLRREVAALCAGRYEESNARLAAMTGLDLARWGYAMRTPT
jgi:hypothetical protein